MALLTLGAGGAWAQTGTITYSISTYSSAGSFGSTTVWNSNGTPKMTMTCSGSKGYNTGNGKIFAGDYTLSVSGGYIITGYSITGHSAWNGSNGDVERITPATGTITDGDGNTVTYLDFAGSDVTLNVSDLNSQSVAFTMAQTAGTGNGAFDAKAITITYQVNPQLAIPQLTTDISSPKYYSIKSYNRGGYLSSNGSGQAMTHVDFKDGSVWYFTAADGNTSGNAMNGVIAHNFDGTAMTTSWQTSETGGTVYILPNGVNLNGLSISKTASISNGSCCDANNSNTGVGNYDPRGNDWQGTTWVIEPYIPSGYYYFKGMDTGRYPYLYSNFVGKGENATYHHSPLSGTNGEIWKVTNNGSSLSIINGEGLPLTIGSTTYETLNIGSVAEGPDFYFTQAINLTNWGNDTKLTTWTDGGSGATDNHWTFEAVDVSAGLYNVVIEGNANGYVTYNGQNAKNGGFFVAESIASSDLIAFDISDYTEVVSVEGTTITVTYEEDGETINYTLTDTNDATYTGTYKGTVGTTEPTFTGCVGYTLSDKVWDGSTFTATINFPFAISSNNVENLTYIGSFHNKDTYSPKDFLWHANGTSVTVHYQDVPNNTQSEGVYTDEEKYEWVIFPAIADNNITFTIKNVSTGTFINNTTTGNNHNAGTVTLSETATPVQYATGSTDKCGTIYKWYIPSTSNYLSVNSVTGGTDQVLGVYGTDHDGLSIGFHTPTDFAALDANLIAACTSYQSAQGLIGSEYGQYSGDALAGMQEAYLSATTADALTAAQLTTYTTTLENPTSHLTLNVPQAGDFLRIKASATNKEAYKNPTPSDLYLISSNTQSDVNSGAYKDNRVAFAEGTANDNTTIFYYDGNYLTGFANGLQPVNNNSQLKIGTAGASATKITFESIESTEAKAFRIEFDNGGRSLYTQRYSGAYFTDAAGGNATDAHYRYFLEKVTSLPVTISGAGYATLWSPVALSIPNNVTAYTATDNGQSLTLTPIDGIIPAETGVILRGAQGSYDFTITSTEATASSVLTGQAATIAKPSGAYYLGKGANGVGFYPAGDSSFTTMAGFKAYLPASQGSKSFMGFQFDDTDAINSITNELNSSEIYNLAGQRLNKLQRGVNIVNGKKVLVK